jgi:hypothetical protein
MADVEVTTSAAASPAAAAGERKAKRNAAWVRWSGIIIGAMALIRVAFFFLPQGLAECDGSDLQSSLRAAIETSTKLKLTSVDNITTLTRNATSATCSMNVKASDGSQARMAYRLELIKGQTSFQVTEVK